MYFRRQWDPARLLDSYGVPLLAAAIFVVAAVVFWPLLDVVLLSVTLAVVVMPLQKRLNRTLHPPISAIILTCTLVVLLFAFGSFIAALLYQNADYLIEGVRSLVSLIERIQAGVYGMPSFVSPEAVQEWFAVRLAGVLDSLTARTVAAPGDLLRAAIFFLAFYLALLSGERVYAGILQKLPGRLAGAFGAVAVRSADTLYAIYVVEVIVAVITFFIAVPFFFFMGYERIFLFSFITAVFQLVPVIGPSVLVVLLALLAVSEGDLVRAGLIIAVGYPVVAAVPDIYIRPFLMGEQTGISKVVLWIGIFGGIHVMGLVGFVFGPLILTWVTTIYGLLVGGTEHGGG
ncbi:MAG: AI-2E family transporter [Methanomicrobiaceae archaeon]|nr:AI-2E family transporter [Methanomicrobiaceae archaeon]